MKRGSGRQPAGSRGSPDDDQRRLRLASGASRDDRRSRHLSLREPLPGISGPDQTTQTTMPAATAACMQLMMSGASLTTSDMYREVSSSGAPSASSGGYRVGDLILQATPQFMASGAPIPPPREGRRDGVSGAIPVRGKSGGSHGPHRGVRRSGRESICT